MIASRRWRSFVSSPFTATMLIAALAAGLVLALRAAGALEGLELAAYDALIRLRADRGAKDPQILLVAVGERDIQKLGRWPISDAVLAQVVERLDRAGARAIGLDMYRDIAVPPGTDRLYEILSRTSRLIAVTMIGDAVSPRVDPPPPLRGTEQVAFNDVLIDSDGIVRRGLLFISDGTRNLPSFALSLVLMYLGDTGVTIQPDPANPQALRLGAAVIDPLESHDGPYVGVDARGYQFLLDFRAGSRAFETVSLTSLLAADVPADAIRGRIVIIGVDAGSVKDHFFTPLSRGAVEGEQDAGLAVHAHAVNQLLRMAVGGEPLLHLPSKTREALLIVACGLIGSLVALRVRSPWRRVLTTAAGLGGLAAGAYLAFVWHWWLPLVPAAGCWLFATGGTTAYLSYREAIERAALMALFSRHVSADVAEAIWAQRDEFADQRGRPRSRHLVVTVLFADIEGYTPTAESLSPEELLDWLNACMGAIAGEIGRHGGMVAQYVGDEVIAIFGAPVARTSEAAIAQDAVRAVECALAIEAALVSLNQHFRSQGRPPATMRIGIFTGPVVSGLLGSRERAEYTVIGDTVNTASRLESFEKAQFRPDPDIAPCRILVGGTTLAYVGDRFVTEFVGDRMLKGKRHPVAVYRVLGRQPAVVLGRSKEVIHEQDDSNLHPMASAREPWTVPGGTGPGHDGPRETASGGIAGRKA